MSQPHIACLFPWLELGGADKFNLDLLRQLTARGWRTTVFTSLPSQHPWRAEFEPLCGTIIDLARAPAHERPTRLLATLAAQPPDYMLISHSHLGYQLLPYLRAHLPLVVYADYCHIEEPHWRAGGYPRMSLDVAGWLDLQFVSSQHLRRWMLAHGGDPAQINVCTTNIEPADWNPVYYDRQGLRAELGIPSGVPLILYAARLERQKQPLLAADVLRDLARRAPQARALIVGEGRFGAYLRRYIQYYGLEPNIRLLGAVSNERMRALLAASDLFFLPSKHEGISLAIYEAMAMGVTPVAAAVGGQAELVTPDCGVLIAPGPGEYQRYSTALLGLVAAPERLRTMGAAARRRVSEHFRLDQLGEQIVTQLAQASKQQREQPRPTPNRAAALAAARNAIAGAELDEHELAPTGGLREYARASYWRLISGPGWRLAPLAERLRT